jgi:hypothetical protein
MWRRGDVRLLEVEVRRIDAGTVEPSPMADAELSPLWYTELKSRITRANYLSALEIRFEIPFAKFAVKLENNSLIEFTPDHVFDSLFGHFRNCIESLIDCTIFAL